MTQISIPMSAESFWLLIICLGLAGTTGLIYWALSVTGRAYRRPGWENIPEGWRGVAIFLGLLWLGLFCLTVIAAYTGVWQLIHPSPEGTGKEVSGLGLGALLAAMLGAPFVIWGTVIRHNTLALSETSMFNDKVNGAVAALYSRRQVTKEIVVAGEAKILTEWQDDIVQRSAAIDRLEGLMRERPSEAPRIVNMLSVYVRELSREFPAKDHPRQRWIALVEPEDDSMPMSEQEALDELGLAPDDVSIDALNRWANGLRPFRTDVEKAVQTLGRVREIENVVKEAIAIDLRGMNAQGFDLAELDFSWAKLNGARLEGANLGEARIVGVNFSSARMEGAYLRVANLEVANLGSARMEGAYLAGARMEGAYLALASMVGAYLDGAILDRADLSSANMEQANLSWGSMQGANFNFARMEGTDLSRASMVGASFILARLNASTDLFASSLRGASVKLVDWTTAHLSQAQIDHMFGDASAKLPKGLIRPTNWPDWEMDLEVFNEEWHKWQASPEGYRPPTREEVEARSDEE